MPEGIAVPRRNFAQIAPPPALPTHPDWAIARSVLHSTLDVDLNHEWL